MRIRIIAFFALMALVANAVEIKPERLTKMPTADAGFDLVSNYVWRGTNIDPTPNIQGWGELGYGSFVLGSNTSINVSGSITECDLYLSYTKKRFSVSLTDYFMQIDDYYNFNNNTTQRTDELMVDYCFGDRFPLTIAAHTVLFGNDKKIDKIVNDTIIFSHKNNFSSYIEINYPVKMGETNLLFTSGFSTHKSPFYATQKFALINIGISISKVLKISEHFDLPLTYEIITNPYAKTINSVVKLSF